MKAFKVVAIGIGGLVALLVAVAITIAFLFDPNDYKGYVTDWVESNTGRRLVIDGDLELSFFPWLAVETGGVTLGNAAGFEGADFATIDRVAIRVRLIPLFSRRFEVGAVLVDGLVLDLAATDDGRRNWDDLLATSDEPAAPATAGEQAGPLDAMDIESIALRGARIVWRENSTEPRYVVSELDLETDSIAPDRPLRVDLSANFQDMGSRFAASIDTTATVLLRRDGRIEASDIELALTWRDADAREQGNGRLTLEELQLPPEGSILARGGAISARLSDPPIGSADLETNVTWEEISIDRSSFAVEGREIALAVGGIRSTWQVASELTGDGSAIVRGSLASDGPAAELLALLGTEPPAGLTAAELGNFTAGATFTFDTATRRLDTRDVAASAFGINLRASQVASGASVTSARIDIAPFRPTDTLRRVMAAYLPPEIDVSAIGRLALRADVAMRPQQTTLSGIQAELLGANISGELTLPGAGGSTVAASITTDRFAPDELLNVIHAYLPESIDTASAGTFALSTSLRYDTSNGDARLEQLRLEAFGLNAAGQISVTDSGGNATYAGQVSLGAFDPREMLGRFGMPIPQTSDDTALRRASVEASFRVTPDTGVFENLVVALDESRISGSLTVRDFSAPSYEFQLNGDRLDVDRYLPPTAEDAASDERTAGDIAISNEQLTALRIDGSVRVGALRLAGLDFQNVATEILVGGGRLQLDSAQAGLYGGTFNGRFHADATAATATVLLEGRTASVQIEPLLRALLGDTGFSGTASFDIDLQGRGMTVTENLGSAAGTLGFALTDGAIDGFNIDEVLCTSYNRLSENPAPRENPPDRTAYQTISGMATVTEGIARSSDLFARAGSFEIRGAGTLSIADEMADYEFDARLAASVPIAGCDTMDHMMNIDFPLVMTGPASALAIRPDYSEVVKRVLQDRVRDSIEERLQDRLRNLVR